MQKQFDNFVSKLTSQLHAIDKAYLPSGCDEQEWCLEKLRIYDRFTSGLIENGSKYLKIINHLETELKNSETTSGTSSSSSDQDERSAQTELTALKQLLDKKVIEEKHAMHSLRKLETTLHSLKLENRKLNDEKKKLELKLAEEEKSMPQINGARSIVKLLRDENDQLRQIIDRHEHTMDAIAKGEPQHNDIESLEHQLNEKEQIIMKLNEALAKKNETRSEISDLIQHQRNLRPLIIDECKDSASLTDAETNDNKKFELFMEGHRELTLLVKEKYRQLREQRAEIKSLKQQLNEQHKNDTSELAAAQAKNTELLQQLDQLKQQKSGEVNNLLQQSNEFHRELDDIKQRETIFSRKIRLQDEHINELLQEREALIRLNNEMLESIAKCRGELSKYVS